MKLPLHCCGSSEANTNTQLAIHVLVSRIRARTKKDAQRREQSRIKKAVKRLEAKWGKFPKTPLSVIACPFPKCDHHCIYSSTRSLAELFDRHVQRVHSVKTTKACQDLIESKIRQYNSFKYYPYRDPFLYVALEDVTR